MDKRDIRLSRLRTLVGDAGGPTAFSRKHDGVDPTYISQLLNGHRNFGERAARAMEAKLGLPAGGLDRTGADDAASGWPFARLSKADYDALKPSQREAIEDWVIDQVERFLGNSDPAAKATKAKKSA
jgi:hypothetical protein